MYYAPILYEDLKNNFGPEYIGQELRYSQICRRLNKFLTKTGSKVKTYKDPTLEQSKNSKYQPFTFSGYYEGDKEEFPITIFIHMEPNRNYFKFTKNNYSNFIFVLSQTIQHELIHFSQDCFRDEDYEYSEQEKTLKVKHSNRLGKQRIQQIKYLSDWSEIEAYAHDIAMEINFYYPDQNHYHILKNMEKYPKLVTYRYFTSVFKGTEWFDLKKTLISKILRWIDYAPVPYFL